jgi:hypothetical protein
MASPVDGNSGMTKQGLQGSPASNHTPPLIGGINPQKGQKKMNTNAITNEELNSFADVWDESDIEGLHICKPENDCNELDGFQFDENAPLDRYFIRH